MDFRNPCMRLAVECKAGRRWAMMGVEDQHSATMSKPTPRIVDMRIVPVAGYDSMLLNLSGAHGPFFTRNLVILTDDAGNTGVGEVPGGEKIRGVLEDAGTLV